MAKTHEEGCSRFVSEKPPKLRTSVTAVIPTPLATGSTCAVPLAYADAVKQTEEVFTGCPPSAKMRLRATKQAVLPPIASFFLRFTNYGVFASVKEGRLKVRYAAGVRAVELRARPIAGEGVRAAAQKEVSGRGCFARAGREAGRRTKGRETHSETSVSARLAIGDVLGSSLPCKRLTEEGQKIADGVLPVTGGFSPRGLSLSFPPTETTSSCFMACPRGGSANQPFRTETTNMVPSVEVFLMCDCIRRRTFIYRLPYKAATAVVFFKAMYRCLLTFL